jgi:NTP pyrophosphatase (non-canonical NTP hydrolase)
MNHLLEETPFAQAVRKELSRAREGHAPQNSAHESYAVILEEVDEFWEEVRKKKQDRSEERMLKELVQIAAMCQRAAEDLALIEKR